MLLTIAARLPAALLLLLPLRMASEVIVHMLLATFRT
jgi:hypothetical protein